jgi:hypothetical protein
MVAPPFRANNFGSQGPTGPFANDQSGIDVGDVPLQDMPRLSTETTRCNGFRQSVAPEHTTRILADIRDEV